ncbi:MurR/RpiR family transcriptional regulator [Fonticella tunisiensis]|uniref:RpiR family transcriptional regulator n=1 Tax=Fonticella tunisiensis TaxID=1096341 RepID=A0A4R7KBP7_9CLOT|nr:MurR/RpiR family transcriptional regulator [Fonticella tunisiensis]TDT51968.1 RpiR family transcriptional regulator [Fonticella tunisiensis]
MDFFIRIEKEREKLNKNENELLKYFIENAQDIKNMKIQDVAKKTFVSTAGIIRFCKKLGFNGYSELKNSLALTVKNQGEKGRVYTQSKTSSNIFNDIDKTKDMINDSIIDEITDLIHETERIDFYGEGSSRLVCMEMSRRFQLVGKQTYHYDDTSIMYLSASTLKEKDLVFAISMSGETSQIIRAVNIAKTKKATVVSLTSMSLNTLSNIADKSLFIYSTKYSINGINFISRIPAIILMEYVFNKYVEKYVG